MNHHNRLRFKNLLQGIVKKFIHWITYNRKYQLKHYKKN